MENLISKLNKNTQIIVKGEEYIVKTKTKKRRLKNE